MFKLKSLTLKNFMAFKDATINFSKPGLYIITGFNEVGGDSNGAGKSCILSAISYALWGRTEGGLKKDQITRWGTTSHSVILELEGPQGSYKIERTLDYTRLFINDKQVLPEAWRKKEIQDTINDTFKSDPKIFFSATMFDRNLADMGDAGKKDLLKGILNLEELDLAYQKVRLTIDSLSTKATSLQTEIEMLESEIPEVKGKMERYREKSVSFNLDRQKKMENIQTELSQPIVYDVKLGQSLKFHQSKEEQLLAQSEKRLESSSKLVEGINSLKEAIAVSSGKVQDRKEQLNEILDNASFNKCRLCGGPIKKEQIEQLKNSILNSIQKETQIQKALSERAKVWEEQLASLCTEDLELENTKKKINELRVQVISMESKAEAWESTKKRLEVALQELAQAENTYEELHKQTIKEYTGLEARLKDASAIFGVVTKDIDIYQFLKWVFSREGVSSYIIEKSFNRLQSLANHYLSKVCKEGFKLHISPQRELKSKALKEEIDISILQDGRKIAYAALSGGQRQRLNIALVVALFKLCRDMKINMFDFLLLDEVLDLSLAEKGQEDMVALLRILLAEISQVIVISHKVGISQDFDYEIQVRRDLNGVAHI